jgi:ABC-2 type transport system permease protein
MMFSIARWWALTRKEFRQLKKNRQLLFQLLIPPTAGLCMFGFSLNPDVKHLRMGVVDESATPESRAFVDRLAATEAFAVTAHYGSAEEASTALRNQKLDLAVVIPEPFARRAQRDVQVLIDAVNANTATIAQSYLVQIVAEEQRPIVHATSVILYNPGTLHAWYFVTGVLSIMLFINGGLTASALTVREKELGTIEQLLMSPAQTPEILLAKTTPVLTMMMVVLTTGIFVSWLVFDLPLRGSLPLLGFCAGFAALSGIGIGITAATFTNSQQQAQLLTFFVMPPLTMVSGAFSPIEAMPPFFQYLSLIDPVRYMTAMVRGITIRGSGMDVLWPQLAILGLFSLVLYGVSAWRFRGQLQ